MKKLYKIMSLLLALTMTMLTLAACDFFGGDGSSQYEISDLSDYTEQVAGYVIDPNVADIMVATGESQAQTMSLSKKASTVANVAVDNEPHYNDTAEAYSTLPDSLVELENAAKCLANKVKPGMNKVLKEIPEENVWVGYTADIYIAEDTAMGLTTFAKVNTNTEGVLEHISVSYNTETKTVDGGTYVKLTETDVEDEPIVEYAEVSYHNGDTYGKYMYYVPGQQIYVRIADINSAVCEYYCINNNGNFTAMQSTGFTKTIVDGNTTDGFMETIYNIYEPQENIYNYYKDNHKIMSLGVMGLSLDLYSASNVEVVFSESVIENVSDDNSSQYQLVKDIDSFVLPSDVEYNDSFSYNDNCIGEISTDIATDYGTTKVYYYVTEDAMLLEVKNPFTDNFAVFTSRDEGNLTDKLFGKDRVDEMYNIYTSYFNSDSTILQDSADNALTKITKTECSFDFAGFATGLKTLDAHYIYRQGTGEAALEANYPTQLESLDLSSYYVANHSELDQYTYSNNPEYAYSCTFNGYYLDNKTIDVVFALTKDGQSTTVAKGNKNIMATDSIDDAYCNVTFSLSDIIDAIATDGQIDSGRYDMVTYFVDCDTNKDMLDSLTEVSACVSSSQYTCCSVEYNGRYYNVKIHNDSGNKLDFDMSLYILIEEVK